MENSLILWNSTSFSSILEERYGKGHVITSSIDYNNQILAINSCDILIVLCELDWTSKSEKVQLQQCSGIDLVKELRRDHDLKAPVLFVSFLPLEYIFNAEREILTSIGHNFAQLPIAPDKFHQYFRFNRKLSSTELRDVQLFSCSPKGIVSSKIHQIQGLANQTNQLNPKALKEQMIQCIKDIHNVFHSNADEKISFFCSQFELINNENINQALRMIELVGKDLIDKYVSLNNGKFTTLKKKPWRILLLDDEIDENSEFVKELSKVVDVVCTSTADEAMNELKNDNQIRGEIVLIITDYRLNEKQAKTITQQKTQGYTFLHEVGELYQSRLLSAIVFSGMPRQFLFETFHTYKIRTEIFSKSDYKLNDSAALELLISRIIEKGDENYEALIALPLASDGWRDYLHDTYLLYRNQKDYYSRETKICEECALWIEEFRNGNSPLTPMIKADVFKPLKNDTTAKTIERFEAFYKTRRLAQYLNLYFEDKDYIDVQSKIIEHLGNFSKETSYDTPESKRRFFSQKLGFKRDEFPFGATIEELRWFDMYMDIPTLSGYQKYRKRFSDIENRIGAFISNSKYLKGILKSENFCFQNDRKNKLMFKTDSCKPYIFDKLDLGLCFEWLGRQHSKMSKIELEEYTEMIEDINLKWI